MYLAIGYILTGIAHVVAGVAYVVAGVADPGVLGLPLSIPGVSAPGYNVAPATT